MAAPEAEERELTIDYGDGKATILVQAQHTLVDVRQIILDEFDDDMIVYPDWVFWTTDGVRKTAKQEPRVLAFKYLENGLCIGPKKRIAPVRGDISRYTQVLPSKRARLDETTTETNSTTVTPVETKEEIKEDQLEDASLENGVVLDKAMEPSVLDVRFDAVAEGDKQSDQNDPEDSSANQQVPSPPTKTSSSPRPQEQASDTLVDATPVSWSSDDEDGDVIPMTAVDDEDDDSLKDAHEENEGDEDPGDEEGIREEARPEDNPHKEADAALQISRQVIESINGILADPQQQEFCSNVRRVEWQAETRVLLEKSSPKTIIGVLGNTGVGKSSLLNALLDEASVLPTSGSRGCTAAVVELMYNQVLAEEPNGPRNDEIKVPVYRGEVQFMTEVDWNKELKILVSECSTQEHKIYAIPPIGDTQPVVVAAWSKIDQVYGTGTMERCCGQPENVVLNRLMRNPRVTRLLRPTVPGAPYNTHVITEGESVPGSEESKIILHPNTARERRKRKNWAKSFRNKINSYVYRTGNGFEPQMWPLIRKVQLAGPWQVLATGACLVDLPGVRDSNAARAKVSESYLQHCNQIWIVAPIKRAVDDGTAKELLGEQFKRRLLMDGQYGNVSFICTQTDDLEATETMRDHRDVAERLGHWEKMDELATEIARLEKKEVDMSQEEEDLKYNLSEADTAFRDARSDRRKASKSDRDVDIVDTLNKLLGEAKEKKKEALEAIKNWRDKNKGVMEKERIQCGKMQRELKTLCSVVRNEYSKTCLQADFRNGLKELYRNDDDGPDANNKGADAALPDYNMDVFCISSNDYLKLMGIKESRDGPPNCFSKVGDTQIPMLRGYVHMTTSRFRKTFAHNFVQNTNDLLDRMKLLAQDSKDVPSGRDAYRLKRAFEGEMTKLARDVGPVAHEFTTQAKLNVTRSLQPSLRQGAQQGNAAAMQTVHSWGSSSRRSKSHRTPEQNGLYWGTYNAVVRRNGVYTSVSAGQVDFNQELLDPMEKAFSTEWQRVMDTSIKGLLSKCESQIYLILTKSTRDLAQALSKSGIQQAQLSNMMNAASRSCVAAIKTSFQQMSRQASDLQRELSRSLLPSIQERMGASYTACMAVPRGSGVFHRMKSAMGTSTNHLIGNIFNESLKKVLDEIESMIVSLSNSISSIADSVKTTMHRIFSMCWESTQSQPQAVDLAVRAKIQACRDNLLPKIMDLYKNLGAACGQVGIQREEQEFEVMQVETLDQGLARRYEKAKNTGDAFDLCDSDTECDVVPKVKAEPSMVAAVAKRTTVDSSGIATIDLCDSDDDWMPSRRILSCTKKNAKVKSERI